MILNGLCPFPADHLPRALGAEEEGHFAWVCLAVEARADGMRDPDFFLMCIAQFGVCLSDPESWPCFSLRCYKIAAAFSAVWHAMVLEALLNHQRVSSHEYLMKFKHCANTPELAFVKHSAAPAKRGTLEKPFLLKWQEDICH